MSLEPAGDPRTLEALLAASKAIKPKAGKAGWSRRPRTPATARPRRDQGQPAAREGARDDPVRAGFLYRVSFSNTANMITAMRVGELPTAARVRPLGAPGARLRDRCRCATSGLDDKGVIQAPSRRGRRQGARSLKAARPRNELFSNAELGFRKAGGPVQTYRHIQNNLDDAHLKKDPRVLKHLEAKGTIASMTKAASYLLSWDIFVTMRNYLINHTVWIVSDATGVAPTWGKASRLRVRDLRRSSAWRTSRRATPSRRTGATNGRRSPSASYRSGSATTTARRRTTSSS